MNFYFANLICSRFSGPKALKNLSVFFSYSIGKESAHTTLALIKRAIIYIFKVPLIPLDSLKSVPQAMYKFRV